MLSDKLLGDMEGYYDIGRFWSLPERITTNESI